jgi:hypothetical protein
MLRVSLPLTTTTIRHPPPITTKTTPPQHLFTYTRQCHLSEYKPRRRTNDLRPLQSQPPRMTATMKRPRRLPQLSLSRQCSRSRRRGLLSISLWYTIALPGSLKDSTSVWPRISALKIFCTSAYCMTTATIANGLGSSCVALMGCNGTLGQRWLIILLRLSHVSWRRSETTLDVDGS